MPTQGFITYKDYSGEVSTVTFNLPEITALNFAGVTQDLDEIADGLAALTLGNVVNKGFTRTYNDDVNLDPVTEVNAQRERKWLVTMRDTKSFLDLANSIGNPNKNKLFSFEVPTADISALPQGLDSLPVESAEFIALKAALEPNVKSAINASAPAGVGDTAYCALVSVRHVGRNL